MKVTRRELAAALAGAVALPAAEQAAPQAPADPLEAARARLKAQGEALAKEKIPMATEPAVVFHAE